MKSKYFLIIPISIVLLSSTISYAPAVQTDPKKFEAKRKEFVTLVNKITHKAKLGESPTTEELQRIKDLLPYSPKTYKGNILFEIDKTMPYNMPEIIKLNPKINKYEQKYSEIKKHIDSPLFIKLNAKKDASKAEKNDITFKLDLFNKVFGKSAEEILNDLLIPTNIIQKYYNFLMIGKDSVANKISQGKHPYASSTKITPKIQKMARNQLAEEIISKYIDENLQDINEQKKYFEILLHKFTPDAENHTIGYNPKKIETLYFDLTTWLNEELKLFKKLKLEQKLYLILGVDKKAETKTITDKRDTLIKFYDPSSFKTEELKKIANEIKQIIEEASQSMIDELKSKQPVVPGAPVVAPGAPVVAPGAPVVVPGAPVIAPGAPVIAPGAPVIAPGAPVIAPGAPVKPGGEGFEIDLDNLGDLAF